MSDSLGTVGSNLVLIVCAANGCIKLTKRFVNACLGIYAFQGLTGVIKSLVENENLDAIYNLVFNVANAICLPLVGVECAVARSIKVELACIQLLVPILDIIDKNLVEFSLNPQLLHVSHTVSLGFLVYNTVLQPEPIQIGLGVLLIICYLSLEFTEELKDMDIQLLDAESSPDQRTLFLAVTCIVMFFYFGGALGSAVDVKGKIEAFQFPGWNALDFARDSMVD